MPITPSLIPLPWCAFFSQVMGTSLNHRHTLGHHSHGRHHVHGDRGICPKRGIPTVLSSFGHGEHAPGCNSTSSCTCRGMYGISPWRLLTTKPPQPYFSSFSRISPTAGTGLSLTPLPSRTKFLKLRTKFLNIFSAKSRSALTSLSSSIYYSCLPTNT